MNIWTRTWDIPHSNDFSHTNATFDVYRIAVKSKPPSGKPRFKKEMFLCLISLPRILREDVSTNIKDMVWTTPAIPNHLPSPLANLMSLPLLVSDLPRFSFQSSAHSLSWRKGANKVSRVTKDQFDNLLSQQSLQDSLSPRLLTLSLNGHNQDESGLIGHLTLNTHGHNTHS